MILVAKDIYKIYKNGAKEVRPVNGVSLEIEKGKSLAIVGPSGAGKSTLLHLLGGLDSPTDGRVTLDGADIYRLSDRIRAKIRNQRIGFVFQFYHLLPEFTALENVMLPALIRGRTTNESGAKRSLPEGDERRTTNDRARDILKAVRLEDRLSHKPSKLSGGESQRVAIARALVNEPEILLCDEPTGNLDSKTSEAIFELLLELKLKTNMTLIVVTHDENISRRFERTIHIRDGRII